MRRKPPLLINDPRFSPACVLVPKSKADLAFTMPFCPGWLSTARLPSSNFPECYTGAGRVKKPQYLVDNNYIQTVIQLPPDFFL